MVLPVFSKISLITYNIHNIGSHQIECAAELRKNEELFCRIYALAVSKDGISSVGGGFNGAGECIPPYKRVNTAGGHLATANSVNERDIFALTAASYHSV